MKRSTARILSRRQFGRLTAANFASYMAVSAGISMTFPIMAWANQARSLKRSQVLGTTFSQLQCHYMQLDLKSTFRAICELGFDRIRLCAYWDDIERVENEFNFSTLDWLLDECDRHNIKVVLAVGMKVPRWPEFHFPQWLQARHDVFGGGQPLDQNSAIAAHTLNFVQRVVDHARTAPAITHWQVENEPFTRLAIAAGRHISAEFVRQEVELVRSGIAAHQKLVLTGSITLPVAQEATDTAALHENIQLADAVGVNVYTKVPIDNTFFYLEPLPPFWQTLRRWQTALTQNNTEAWVAEAQAEPWEANQLVAMGKPTYPSATPKRTTNLVAALADVGFSTILLWGCEYWYWQKLNQRDQWWRTMQQLVRAERVSGRSE